ncbi:FABP family protein [Agrococcus sp. SGAir0287]|uniref:FABP family protein n=1 Tax=Agrococcus sp. SGAir0287 TaxID=2070347 RepID=UPI0010CCEB04|nr:FABP family protein [Agrococcus sp. SGAir0287]QCR19926.1 FABP family protein [Agrococcus sp. SGAir0287]
MLDIDPTLPAELGPLQWLIGDWEGTGHVQFAVGDDDVREHAFGQRVTFAHHGLPFLAYTAYAWLLDDESAPLAAESGYWSLARVADERDHGPGMLPRAAAPRTVDDVEALRGDDGAFEIEALIAHPTGVAELYMGRIAGPRIDLATDAVMRSPSAKAHSASTRMLGLVEGDLLWAWDLAALGRPLATHASARLSRVRRLEAPDGEG